MRKSWFILLIFSVLVSCGGGVKTAKNAASGNAYATGFSIQDTTGGSVVRLYSPWNREEVMARYVVSDSLCDAMPVVRRMAVTSCTHVGMLDALGRMDCLVGVCQPELVYTDLSTCPYAGLEQFDLGDGMSPSVERIAWLRPDVVMLSVYNKDDVLASRLTELGVPVIYNNEWMESHPLARAEWIRVVGVFVGRRHEADSIFGEEVKRYEMLCKDAVRRREKASRPVRIMSGQDFRGTWYVPSGGTYMGRLFADAGAEYEYAECEQEGSVPLTMEQALRDFGEADVWVGVNVRTMSELADASDKHRWFEAYKSGRVYNFLGRSNGNGGNDFWERGVVHPDEILEDLINVLYPDSVEASCRYMEVLRNE